MRKSILRREFLEGDLAKMAEVDPETLLEWLQMGQGDERDMQLIALEQLCMLLLMSDNVDRCFERYEPKSIYLIANFNMAPSHI